MIVIRVRHTCISEVKEISLKKRQSSPLRVAPFPKKEKDACLCFYSMTEHKKRFFFPEYITGKRAEGIITHQVYVCLLLKMTAMTIIMKSRSATASEPNSAP